MKCKIFYGHVFEVENEFNKWGKDKPLYEGVKVYVLPFPTPETGTSDFLCIVLIYDESVEDLWKKFPLK